MIGDGLTERSLSEDKVRGIVSAAVDAMAPDGRSVLVIVLDHTRTCPLPMLARMLHRALAGRTRRLDFMIAIDPSQAFLFDNSCNAKIVE